MDMNDELRNLAWECLPRETREKIRMIFNMPSKCGYPDSIRRCLLDIYGNILTSDTEPEEMLMVERKTIIERYHALKNPDDESYNQSLRNANILLLQTLFGDKCLPDKEPSVQVEPRFKVGDKVKIKNEDIASVIDSIAKMPDGSFNYHLHHVEPSVRESDLEPYTDPETKDSDNRKALYDALCELESASKKVRKALISLQ